MFTYKYAIKKSLYDLVNKPLDEKNEIETNLDKIFMKFIPKHLMDNRNQEENIGMFLFTKSFKIN